MTLREQTEQRERETLSSRACLAEQTRGRARPEEPCGVRTCFQVDTDRIVYCKSFRLEEHLGLVLQPPEGYSNLLRLMNLFSYGSQKQGVLLSRSPGMH